MYGMCWQVPLMGYNHCRVPSSTSLHNHCVDLTIVFSEQSTAAPKGKITRNMPYERELEAKKNGTYVNTYTPADDKKLRDYCNGQCYKGPI
jgi:hypothetical protein